MRAAWSVVFSAIVFCMVTPGKGQTTTATPAALASPPVDSIQFVSVKTKHDVPIARGKPIDMEVTVRYTLVSQKSAKLSLSTAQFPHSQHCTGSSSLVTAQEIVVHRGSKTVTIPITWPGDSGEKSKGRVQGSGWLSFTGMLWKDNGGGFLPTTARERYGIYDFFNDFCAEF
jgi:hypothetical protein